MVKNVVLGAADIPEMSIISDNIEILIIIIGSLETNVLEITFSGTDRENPCRCATYLLAGSESEPRCPEY
jgi:hypothetical protein